MSAATMPASAAGSAAGAFGPRPTITRREEKALRKLARHWRAGHSERPEFQRGGYVTIWAREACGWTSMEDPAAYRPNVYAVPVGDAPIFVSTGGSYDRGATAWTETEVYP